MCSTAELTHCVRSQEELAQADGVEGHDELMTELEAMCKCESVVGLYRGRHTKPGPPWTASQQCGMPLTAEQKRERRI